MFFLGLVFGIVLTVIIIIVLIPSKMFVIKTSKFGFEETISVIEKSATDMNWGLPHKYDLQATLKGKGFEVNPVQVISVCKPSHANKILNNDSLRQVSALMPCRVAVFEKNGKTHVSILNSGLFSKLMAKNAKEVMKQVSAELEILIMPVIK